MNKAFVAFRKNKASRGRHGTQNRPPMMLSTTSRTGTRDISCRRLSEGVQTLRPGSLGARHAMLPAQGCKWRARSAKTVKRKTMGGALGNLDRYCVMI
jgi:hypothetical protein